jgi:[ribosomal protein S5]-alanine N-acetyltransferase
MRDLETDRLLIRALRPDDRDAFAAIVKASFGDAAHDNRAFDDLVAYHALADRIHDMLHQPPYGERAIVAKASHTTVGLVGFVPCLRPFAQLPSFGGLPDARHTPEVGLFWAVAPDHRRLGIATEAARAMIAYAFDDLRLARIVATTDYDNAASIAVMRRLGMTIDRNPFPTPPWHQIVGFLEAVDIGRA